MKYIPQQIEQLVNSNLSNLYPDWAVDITYVLEPDNENLTSASMVVYGNYIYRSLTDDNLGYNPEETLNIYWVKWAISNKMAMIDLASQTQSVSEPLERSFIESEADYQSDETVSELTIGDVVWDVDTSLTYKVLVSDESLPNSDFNDFAKWEKMFGNIIIEFKRGSIDMIGVGDFKASSITIEHFTAGVLVDGATQVINYSVNDTVVDLWSYVYDAYTNTIKRSIKLDIAPIGDTIKVSFKRSVSSDTTSCGFLIAGESVTIGETLQQVGFSYNSFAIKEPDAFGSYNIIKRNVQDIMDFETVIGSRELPFVRRKVKEIYNDIVLFIADPSDTSDYENLLTLGVIEDVSITLDNSVLSYVSWSVVETT